MSSLIYGIQVSLLTLFVYNSISSYLDFYKSERHAHCETFCKEKLDSRACCYRFDNLQKRDAFTLRESLRDYHRYRRLLNNFGQFRDPGKQTLTLYYLISGP